MNSIRLTLTALACASAALIANAAPSASSVSIVTRPVVTKVVYPTNLGPNFNNETVLIKFHLDRDGVPHDVAPASLMPDTLSNRLVVAVSQWRFKPCEDRNGVAVERDVILPIELSDRDEDKAQRLAFNR